MTNQTHTHCQCDNCSGVDCGQNDPDAYKAEREALQKKRDEEVREELLGDIMQYLRKREWISSEYNTSMKVITVIPFEEFIASCKEHRP